MNQLLNVMTEHRTILKMREMLNVKNKNGRKIENAPRNNVTIHFKKVENALNVNVTIHFNGKLRMREILT